jgi:hypothetical protein
MNVFLFLLLRMAEFEDDFELDEDLVDQVVKEKHVKLMKSQGAVLLSKRDAPEEGSTVPAGASKPRKKKAKAEFQPLLPPVIASDETDAAFRLREWLWTEFLIYHKTVKKSSSLEIEELEKNRWDGIRMFPL